MSKRIELVYLAGPIGANDEGRLARVEAALAVGARLRDAGLEAFVPHLAHWWDERHPADYERWMRYDRVWLVRCDALLRIPGDSPGADREVLVAIEHGIPVFHDVDNLIVATRTV